MSAVLVAVFSDYEVAESVRLALIEEGFPTDRVELTHSSEPGRAGLEPAASAHGRFEQYFRMLFGREAEHHVERCTECVESGGASVTVLPRGAIEITSATEILERGSPVHIAQRDLTAARLEHAAARKQRPWISNFWMEPPAHDEHEAHCIYCRLERLVIGRSSNPNEPRP